jgi:hypothetical protein
MATLPLILFLSADDAPDTGVAQAAPAMGIRPRQAALLDSSPSLSSMATQQIDRRAAAREPIPRLL